MLAAPHTLRWSSKHSCTTQGSLQPTIQSLKREELQHEQARVITRLGHDTVNPSFNRKANHRVRKRIPQALVHIFEHPQVMTNRAHLFELIPLMDSLQKYQNGLDTMIRKGGTKRSLLIRGVVDEPTRNKRKQWTCRHEQTLTRFVFPPSTRHVGVQLHLFLTRNHEKNAVMPPKQVQLLNDTTIIRLIISSLMANS